MLRKNRPNYLETLESAQRLAFAPLIFQAAAAALRSGLLKVIAENPGISSDEAAGKAGMTAYAAEVVTDMLVPAGILERTALAQGEENGSSAHGLKTTPTGDLLVYDEMTRANFFFSESVCYAGLAFTREALAEGKPAGLKAFNPGWKTIYPHLPELPGEARSAWFGFDHWHSDQAYGGALNILARMFPEKCPGKLVDIGGNTGRFSKAFLLRFPDAKAVIADLPVEVDALPQRPELAQVRERLSGVAIDWLTPDELADRPQALGADLYWMSQFLDCFSEAEAVSILTRTRRAMAGNSRLAVLEPLVDEQRHRAAELSLAATSLYFTVLANGNSKFFNGAELRRIFDAAGFVIESEHPDLGVSHTLFILRPRDAS